MRRMDGKCLVFRVPRRCRFETSYIGTMTKLGLCVAANELVVVSLLQEGLVLLWRALLVDCDLCLSASETLPGKLGMTYHEHTLVQPIWARFADQLGGRPVLGLVPSILDFEVSEPLSPGQGSLKTFHPPSEIILRLIEHLLGLEHI